MSKNVKRRNTPAKKNILNFLEQSQEAVNHEMIEQAMNGKMNRVTIYRILNAFEEDGVVHKVMSDNGVAHYALCASSGCSHHKEHKHLHNHLHFRCEKCNTISCMDESLEVNIPDSYIIHNVNFTISGICPSCQR